MSHSRWHWVPISLVAGGVTLVCLAAAMNYRALGWWQAPIYVGGVIALAAVLCFRRQLSADEVELAETRRQLQDGTARLADEREQWAELRRQIEKQFEVEAVRLEKRERELAERFLVYHEWMEFPRPIDLSQPAVPIELAQLANKDRQMMELLRVETKVLYENIKSNKYATDGQFDPRPLRDDLYVLIGQVARIYRPDVEQPLYETNMSLVVRAASRACLHFLVVIDELPLGVQDYSFNSLYSYVRSAINAYSMYKSTEPYWPYMNSAYYLSRFALGANPLTLGAWWFLSTIGTRGAKALTTHLVNRQALALLSDVVRVIGYEVASIYGGDFRHRDANWIYGAELAELVSQFPLSRDSLSHALKEVGTLQLRSEYDRIFLYRCLAAHVTARPQQYRANEFLSMEERLAIAGRLERFLATFVHGKTNERVATWKAAAESRLGIRLALEQATAPSTHSVQAQVEDAIRSLASFLVSVKELEPHNVGPLLAGTQLMAELPEAERSALVGRLHEQAPYFFEHPDLDPASDLVTKYLEDLANLHVRTPPRDASIDDTLADVAAYLRKEPSAMRALLKQRYKAYFAERLGPEAPVRKVSTVAARAALDLLEPGEQARFIYGNISLEWPAGTVPPPLEKHHLWLLGVGQRLMLVSVENPPRLLWRAEGHVKAEVSRSYLTSACRLTGGRWLSDPAHTPAAIRIASPLLGALGDHFGPLLKMIDPAQSDLPLLEGKVSRGE